MQHQKDIIIITAAGTKTWLRERLTPSAWGRMFGEAGITGYKEKMDALRSVDDRIFEWIKDLHKLVKKMRQAAKAARYVDVAIYLSEINKKFQNVKSVGKEIKKLTDEDILPFELEHKQQLPEGNLFSVDDEDDDEEGLKSEAGLSDMKRRWVAKRLEHNMRAARKIAIKELLNRTESLVDLAQNKLNDLSIARSSGNIGDYIKIIGEISQAQTEFQNYFMPVYKKYLEPLVQKAMEEKKKLEEEAKKSQEQSPDDVREALGLQPAKKPNVEVAKETQPGGEGVPLTRRIRGPGDLRPETEAPKPEIETPEPEATPDAPAKTIIMRPRPIGPWESGAWKSAPAPSPLPMIGNPEEFLEKARQPKPKPRTKTKKVQIPAVPVPAPPPPPPPEKPATAMTHLEQILVKTAHRKFMAELFTAADQNDPYLLAAMLLKYAGQIEDVDLEKSLQLTAIAEGILDAS